MAVRWSMVEVTYVAYLWRTAARHSTVDGERKEYNSTITLKEKNVNGSLNG